MCVFTYLSIRVLTVPKQDVSHLVWLRGGPKMNHGGRGRFPFSLSFSPCSEIAFLPRPCKCFSCADRLYSSRQEASGSPGLSKKGTVQQGGNMRWVLSDKGRRWPAHSLRPADRCSPRVGSATLSGKSGKFFTPCFFL